MTQIPLCGITRTNITEVSSGLSAVTSPCAKNIRFDVGFVHMVESKEDVIKMNTDVLSDLIINRIDSVSTIYTKENTGSKRRNRPQWALVIKYEGETRYVSGGKEYVSNIHHIAVLPKGCDYDWICKKSGHFSIVEFECEKTYPDIFLFHVKNGESIHKTIEKMEAKRTLKETAYRLDELRDLYGILSFLIKNAEPTYVCSSKKQKILPAIEYIAQHYTMCTKPTSCRTFLAHGEVSALKSLETSVTFCGHYTKRIRNDELASVTGLSTVYFRKLFKDVMGISPMRYVQSVRMGKAEKMLNSDYSSITDIAYSLGYNNVYEFSRDFKKYAGISPSKYAERYKK